MDRKILRLRREALAELAPGDLAGVVAAGQESLLKFCVDPPSGIDSFCICVTRADA